MAARGVAPPDLGGGRQLAGVKRSRGLYPAPMWPFVVTLGLLGIVLALVLLERGKKKTPRKRDDDDDDDDARDEGPTPRRRPRRASRGEGGSSGSSFADAIAALALRPTAENYLKLCAIVTAQPSYQPYSGDLDELMELYEAGRYAEAKRRIKDMMSTWVLTPSVHMIACMIAKKSGDEQTAMLELRLADACIEGMLATGDGTKDAPYVVVRVKDEYDLIRHLKKVPAQQGLLRDGERDLDHFELKDGSELYFDVTIPKSHLDRALAG